MTWTSKTVETVLSYPKAIMTFRIGSGVAGRKIIDAVCDIIEENRVINSEIALVEEHYYRDEEIYFVIGRQSMYPYEDLIITVNDASGFTDLIHPIKDYMCIQVVSHHWRGEKYPIGYGDQKVVDACRKFRDQLFIRLETQSQPGE